MLWLEIDREGLEVRPDPEVLERIDFDGVLRQGVRPPAGAEPRSGAGELRTRDCRGRAARALSPRRRTKRGRVVKILSLSVSGAGRFDRPVSVTGFGDGVNVLCEANEAGKSTLFPRAQNLPLRAPFQQHAGAARSRQRRPVAADHRAHGLRAWRQDLRDRKSF